MTLTLLPDVGDLLRLSPQYNAGTVVELMRFLGASEVWWATGSDPDHPLRDALPAARIGIRDVAPEWAWADAEYHQLTNFLNQYPQGRERLRAAGQAERALSAALAEPLSAHRAISPELLDAARAYHDATRTALDEGPGTRWQERRLSELAAALQGQSGVVLVALDDLPGLQALLPLSVLPDLTNFAPGEPSRVRALADRAWQLNEGDDLGALLAALDREPGDAVTPKAELDAAAASIHLAVGDLVAARALLERAAHGLTDLPRSLPGLTLARLGQVRDAQGDRDLAVRTYRAVLALSHAPTIARETAEAGLKVPFSLEIPATD
ncbi:hypothetical protein [Deinococcus puniceus]|uniref:Tetratricopeptide repeat protein n=1 Tax=Deinococcus puniceus TaxID=1182568 RepID=A0A172T9X8_9DEIO|nr:hypothetical protein [Deinococcus puniceus]ANE43762.1 hypothetical protein SU48_08235 [Deinococcus puniceus]